MKSKLYIKSFHSILLLMITFLMNVTIVFGQSNVNSTKITDGSVPNSTVNTPAVAFSILELESNSKGFLLPRMTTAERDKIVITDKIRGNGLAIYNTDHDCINYWSRSAGKVVDEGKWLSVCGELPPATFEMENCSRISLNASGQTELTQGRSLRDTDVLYVSVNVKHSGSFSISAVTDNGYSFSKSGIFETPGIYSVALEGFGTPMNENATTGDLVTFTLNGKKDIVCNQFRIKVKSSAIDFKIESVNTVNWTAYKGVALTGDTNRIELVVNVITAGFWRIQSTDTQNGISLSGSGEFDQEDVGKNVTIYIYGQGTPQAVGQSTFSFKTNSKTNNTSTATVDVTTVEASFEFACANMDQFVVRGEFQEDAYLTKANSVTIPVKVINPGPISIVLTGTFDGVGGTVDFRATDVFLGKPGDVQLINFTPDRTKVPLGTRKITFSSVDPNSVVLCSGMPTVEVKERSRVYSVNCGYVRPTGTYRIEKPLVDGKDGIVVQVNVGYADTYNIKTNTVNGVSFSGTGTFNDGDRTNGTKEITLYGTGIPEKADVFSFEITTYAADGSVYYVCTASVSFVGPTINVLAIGYDSYTPSGTNTSKAPNAIIQNTKLFGPQGKVKINDVKLFKNSPYYRFPSNLSSYLKTNDIDIVIVAYPTRYDDAEFQALRDFITNDKGVVIMSDELNMRTDGGGSTDKLVSALQNGAHGLQSTNGREAFTMVNSVLESANNDILIKDSGFGSMVGRHTGNDASGNGWYYKGLDSNVYVPLIVSNLDSTWVHSFRHKTLGFVFIGDGGAFSGSEGGYPSRTIWPVAYSNDGSLFGKEYLDRGQTYTVYNSILYANMLKWAIEYVLVNKK